MTIATMTEPRERENNYAQMPASITLIDVRVPFGRAFATCLKWGFAALLSGFVLSFLAMPLWIILGVLFSG